MHAPSENACYLVPMKDWGQDEASDHRGVWIEAVLLSGMMFVVLVVTLRSCTG